MKRIIKGKIYDTDTAKLRGAYSVHQPNDIMFMAERLYQKEDGEFFLYTCDNCKYSPDFGESLIVIDEKRAKKWISSNSVEEKMYKGDCKQEVTIRMKKIINGKLYNTETAERIDSWDNGQSTDSFKYIKETLYKKKNNEFFLYRFAGALTEYHEYDNGDWVSSRNIEKLTEDEAKLWTENHLSADKYIETFGEVAE